MVGAMRIAPIRSVLCCALVATIFGSPALALAGGVDVEVAVTGLRNMKGKVQICLTSNPKAWPDCSRDSNARKRTVAATDAGRVVFSDVSPGTYAFSLIHDENGNGKLDTTVIIPKEGFGFSRNPAVTFGPPKFKSAQFNVGTATVSQSIKMKYMF